MKIGYNSTDTVQHGMSHGQPLSLYVVNLRSKPVGQCGYSHDYILMAGSGDDAIARLLQNMLNVIERVRAESKPADLVKHSMYLPLTVEQERRIVALKKIIEDANETLDKHEGKTDFIATGLMETAYETRSEAHKELLRIKEPKLAGKRLNRFEQRVAGIQEKLSYLATATLLREDEAYSVSYFDDSVLRYVPE